MSTVIRNQIDSSDLIHLLVIVMIKTITSSLSNQLVARRCIESRRDRLSRACYELLEMVNSWNDQETISK
jgi:hypothetical protein